MTNTIQSSKTSHKPRRQPFAGEVFPAGTVIRADGSDGTRNRMVLIQCAHCPKENRVRYRDLVSGRIETGGCGKSASFASFHQRRLSEVHPRQRKQIFNDAYLNGKKAAAKTHELKKATVDWIWRSEWNRLSRMSKRKQDSIYVTAQLSDDQAMERFELSRAEVLAICKLVTDRLTAETALLKASHTPKQWAVRMDEDLNTHHTLRELTKILNKRKKIGGTATFTQDEYQTSKESGGKYYTIIESLNGIPDAYGAFNFGNPFLMVKKARKRTIESRETKVMMAKSGKFSKELKETKRKSVEKDNHRLSPSELADVIMGRNPEQIRGV